MRGSTDSEDDVLSTIRDVMPEHSLLGDCPIEIETDVVSSWGEHYR